MFDGTGMFEGEKKGGIVFVDLNTSGGVTDILVDFEVQITV